MDLVTHFQLLNPSKSDEGSALRLGHKRTVAFVLPSPFSLTLREMSGCERP